MSVDSILKKEGISIVRKLDTLEINRIAKNISDKIINSFSDYLLSYDDLFSAISRIDMYLAKMPADSACAKYLYMNNSIYFNEANQLDISENSIFALHECIHFVQTCRDEFGKVYKLGLYEIGKSGVAINEAAVQYMASIAFGSNLSNEKYYDININTISPDYYPLECAILEEMLYFTGTHPLYQSTLNSNEIFKNTFISCSNQETYNIVENNLDKLLKLEDDIYYFSMEIANSTKEKDFKLLRKLIENRKASIKKLFFETQDTIIRNCFTSEFDKIKTPEDIKVFKDRLYKFKDTVCYTDDYEYYNEFYRDAMSGLDVAREVVKSGKTMLEYKMENTSLVVQDNSFNFIKIFKTIFHKIRTLFSINKQELQNTIAKNK